MEPSMPFPPLLVILTILVNLESEALEVGTTKKNEYEDNHWQIHGKVETGEAQNKNMEDYGRNGTFKENPIQYMTEHEQDAKLKEKAGYYKQFYYGKATLDRFI